MLGMTNKGKKAENSFIQKVGKEGHVKFKLDGPDGEKVINIKEILHTGQGKDPYDVILKPVRGRDIFIQLKSRDKNRSSLVNTMNRKNFEKFLINAFYSTEEDEVTNDDKIKAIMNRIDGFMLSEVKSMQLLKVLTSQEIEKIIKHKLFKDNDFVFIIDLDGNILDALDKNNCYRLIPYLTIEKRKKDNKTCKNQPVWGDNVVHVRIENKKLK